MRNDQSLISVSPLHAKEHVPFPHLPSRYSSQTRQEDIQKSFGLFHYFLHCHLTQHVGLHLSIISNIKILNKQVQIASIKY